MLDETRPSLPLMAHPHDVILMRSALGLINWKVQLIIDFINRLKWLSLHGNPSLLRMDKRSPPC